MKIHPSDLMLEELLFKLGGDRRAILSHLSRCRYCQYRLDSLKTPASPPAAEPSVGFCIKVPPSSGYFDAQMQMCQIGELPDYGALIERTERQYLERTRMLDNERRDARSLVTELMSHPRERRRLLLDNSVRFHTWGVYEHLLDRSWEQRLVDTDASKELAHLALHLSDRLDAAYYSPQLIEDLRARGWSYIANVHRMVSDLDDAERDLKVAYEHLKAGTKEPLERANFLELKGVLRVAQRRFDEAMTILRRASDLFKKSGDDLRSGRCLVSLANAFELSGQSERAIEVLQSALPLVSTEDEFLFLQTRHNLAFYLSSAGRFIEAQGLFRKINRFYAKFDATPLGHRRLWLKARIDRGLGQSVAAEAQFVQARERFLDKNIPYEAAMVSLELASLYAEQHRTEELKQLAVEMLPIFASRKIHREAIAAFAFLVQAAKAERVSAAIVAQVAAFVQRVQTDPTLKFEAPSA